MLFVEARLPVGLGHLPKPGVCQRPQRLAQIEARLGVTLARKGEHRVRPRFHAARYALGEVNAQKRKLGIRHGVYQAADKMLALRAYGEVFPAKRDDAQPRISAHHPRHLIGLQSGAVDYVPRPNFPARSFQVELPVPPRYAVNRRVREQIAAVFAELDGIRLRYPLKVDYAGVGRKDCLHARGVRLKLGEPLRPDHLQPLRAVGRPALKQIVQTRNFFVVSGDDYLAAHLILDPALIAKLAQQPAARGAEIRLLRTRRIVYARVDDAAVMPRLMLRHFAVLLQRNNLEARVFLRQPHSRRKPDYPRPNHRDVIPLKTHRCALS